MKKISIIGAGNVGGATALRIADSGIADVVLLVDLAENIALAKANDLEDARYSIGSGTRVEGTSDLSLIGSSNIVIVTAGLPRKPGMTREDLLAKNSQIMTEVCKAISDFAKNSIVIIVSNPLDVMTYLAFKKTKFLRERVFGMGVSLDSSRFANLISKKLLVSPQCVNALVIGSHGETMLPMPRLSKVRDKYLTELLSEDKMVDLVKNTKQRGAEIVSLYGTGSAYMAPSAAIFEIVKTIFSGETKEIPVSVVLDGEYGLSDVAIGVPAKIGPSGIERIIEFDLTPNEKEAFHHSAQSIKDSIALLKI